MRTPDQFGGPSDVTERGGHLAAALARLEQNAGTQGSVLQQATSRLAELVPDVRGIELDRDEVRQPLSVRVKLGGAVNFARSDMSNRHKVFVSYHHALDESYKKIFELRFEPVAAEKK